MSHRPNLLKAVWIFILQMYMHVASLSVTPACGTDPSAFLNQVTISLLHQFSFTSPFLFPSPSILLPAVGVLCIYLAVLPSTWRDITGTILPDGSVFTAQATNA